MPHVHIALKVRNPPSLEQMNADINHFQGSAVITWAGAQNDGPHIQTCMPTDVFDSTGEPVCEPVAGEPQGEAIKLNRRYRELLLEFELQSQAESRSWMLR
jgi:hypothetical protein